MNTIKKTFKTTCNSLILAGVIILIIGFYYSVIKAGIPYQDPPLELQIQYAINMGIGEIMLKYGFLLTVLGMILRIITGIMAKRMKRN